jgi:hypothetical protein
LAKSKYKEGLCYGVFSSLFLFGRNIVLSTTFSYALSAGFFLNVRDQVSQPYRTTGKIAVLYILIFTFFDNTRKMVKNSISKW